MNRTRLLVSVAVLAVFTFASATPVTAQKPDDKPAEKAKADEAKDAKDEKGKEDKEEPKQKPIDKVDKVPAALTYRLGVFTLLAGQFRTQQ